ncbi:Uncharacterised protein [Mycobacteroides abscessus subsp. abscessus]|nr:Uncharacterised protein [Mycobacteroides abscessus subsp. abscessus]
MSAAYTATPCFTGSNAVRYVMVSGAGRRETLRSLSARRARRTTAWASSRYARRFASAASRVSPNPRSREVSAHISTSIFCLSSTAR